MQIAADAGWTIKLILATHAHFDHVLASKALKEMTGAPFYIHHEAAEWLKTCRRRACASPGNVSRSRRAGSPADDRAGDD